MTDCQVYMFGDLGLDPDYNRCMDFTSKSEQKTWFLSHKYDKFDANYNKIQNNFVFHGDVGNVYNYTYAILENIDDSDRDMYVWVTNTQLIDVETVSVTFVIDPIQTFMCEWEIGESLVIREHCDRWGSGNLPIRITPVNEGFDANMITDKCREFSNMEYNKMYGIFFFTANLAYSNNILGVTEDNTSALNSSKIFCGVIPFDVTNPYRGIKFTFKYGASESLASSMTLNYPSMVDFLNGTYIKMLRIDDNAVIASYIIQTLNNKDHWSSSDTICDIYDDDGNIPFQLCSYGSTGYVFWHPYRYWIGHYSERNDIKYIDIDDLTEYSHGCRLFDYDELQDYINDGESFYISGSMTMPTKPTDGVIADKKYEPYLYMGPVFNRIITQGGSIIFTIPDAITFSSNNLYLQFCNTISASGGKLQITVKELNGNKLMNANMGGMGYLQLIMPELPSDPWYEYCFEQRDSDRKMMWSSIIGNVANQAIYSGYGGALVGSRSNSGKNDTNYGTKDNAVPGFENIKSNGMTQAMGLGVGTGLATGIISGLMTWEQQEAKEQSIRNSPASMLQVSDMLPLFRQGLAYACYEEQHIDDVNMDILYNRFRKYGYLINNLETPNIRSRKYFNYIVTSRCSIKGDLNANIKDSIADIINHGVTFFHADYCDDTNYPEYENIERVLM